MENSVLAKLMSEQRFGQPKSDASVDPRILFHRAGANVDEGIGINALQRLLGVNLSPRMSAGDIFQSELPPQNRISETFRMLKGYY